MVATTMPVMRKVSVAAIERQENRAMPRMPWPDVQPEPMRVPTPTRSPATTMTGHDMAMVTGKGAINRGIDNRTQNEADDENRIGRDLLATQKPPDDATDTGDASVHEKKQDRGKAKQHSARQRLQIGGDHVLASDAQKMP